MDIAIMVEGQNGLNWERWRKLTLSVEQLGFWGLFRSDHFTNRTPPDLDSLDLWVSLTWLASHSNHIHFGSMVSPLSFRHPVVTARTASAVDDLSNGRLVLGLGAGWQEREHKMYGFDLLSLDERFQRFEEGLNLIRLLFESEDPIYFHGKFFQADGSVMYPRPSQVGGPPILVGGNGKIRTLPLAARYADEWNSLFLDVETFKELNIRMDQLLLHENRKPTSLTRSMMTGIIFGKSKSELEAKLLSSNQKRADIRQGILVGTGEEIKDQLTSLEEAGLQRIMLQWLDLDDLEGLENLAESIL